MTQLLLEKGATINTFDKKDRRAVHWAAYMGHVDIVRLLVSFGAELGCRDKQVSTAASDSICVVYLITSDVAASNVLTYLRLEHRRR